MISSAQMDLNQYLRIDYVPTEVEMDHIRYLRGEVCWAERKLREASNALAEYEVEIRKKGRKK